MGLFGPKWNSRNFIKARTAVEKLTDQNELQLVAKNCRHVHLQQLAIEKLTDQKILVDIARSVENYTVIRSAIRRLTDQDLLAYIAQNDENADMRFAAVCNEFLTDKVILADIARNDENMNVRLMVKERLENMREREYENMMINRLQEVQKMEDSAALANIAKTDSISDVRLMAIQNRYLTDQTVLAHIAKHDPDESVRVSAAKRITDSTILDSLKDAYCDKNNHIWRPIPPRSNDEAMELHFDRLSLWECHICGLVKALPD